MSYRICANQLPMGKLQADVMQLVSTAFGDLNKEYFVIGATARDILDSELSQKEQSKLLQNCLPKDAEDGVFDMIYTGWQYIQDTISKAIETSHV